MMQSTILKGSGTHVRVSLPKPSDNSKVTIFVDGKLKTVELSEKTDLTFAA